MHRFASFLLLVAGCSVAPSYPLVEVDRPIDGTPVPLEAFCPLFARAVCDAVVACDCGAEVGDCMFEAFDDCAGTNGLLRAEVRDAIDAGRIDYSPDAAGALLGRLAETSRTCDPLTALAWRMEDLLTFDGVLNGTLAPGQACTIEWERLEANECREGICTSDDGAPLACRAVRSTGASCDASTICIDAARSIVVDADLEGRAGRCDRGTCGSPSAAGGPCAEDYECESGRCTAGSCSAVLGADAACTIDFECASGFCADGRCGARTLALGSACTNDGECAEGVCEVGVCAPAICAGYGVSTQ